jgi:hypothetical protein
LVVVYSPVMTGNRPEPSSADRKVWVMNYTETQEFLGCNGDSRESPTRNPSVAGSSPARPTNCSSSWTVISRQLCRLRAGADMAPRPHHVLEWTRPGQQGRGRTIRSRSRCRLDQGRRCHFRRQSQGPQRSSVHYRYRLRSRHHCRPERRHPSNWSRTERLALPGPR